MCNMADVAQEHKRAIVSAVVCSIPIRGYDLLFILGKPNASRIRQEIRNGRILTLGTQVPSAYPGM